MYLYLRTLDRSLHPSEFKSPNETSESCLGSGALMYILYSNVINSCLDFYRIATKRSILIMISFTAEVSGFAYVDP